MHPTAPCAPATDGYAVPTQTEHASTDTGRQLPTPQTAVFAKPVTEVTDPRGSKGRGRVKQLLAAALLCYLKASHLCYVANVLSEGKTVIGRTSLHFWCV